MSLENNKRLHEVDVIRVIAIFLVVLTHSFAINNQAWTAPYGLELQVNETMKLMSSFFRPFRMPAVTFIAGYSFYYVNQRKQYSLASLATEKLHRLIIPSIIFSLIYIILFVFILNSGLSYMKEESSLSLFFISITNGVGHLWFLPMLFWNFLLGYFLIKVESVKFKTIIFITLLSASFLSFAIPNLFGLSKAMQYSPYFYLGIIFFSKRNSFLKNNIKIILISIVSILIVTLCNSQLEQIFISFNSNLAIKAYKLLFSTVLPIFTMLAFYSTVLFFTEKYKPYNFWRKMSKKSYGIYVYHQMIMIAIAYNTSLIYKLDSIGFAAAILLLTIVASMILTELTVRTKVGKYLIG